MDVRKRSSNYDIIDSGIMFSFNINDGFVFEIDNGNNGILTISIDFFEDESNKQYINVDGTNGIFKMMCFNFLSSGTGTTTPVEIGKVNGKKVYLHFWVYLEGDVENVEKTRSIKYTFYIER